MASPSLRVSRLTAVVASLGTLVALGSGGCGPSISTIYEGNIRFEHCYRLDLDLSIAPSHREMCWREWMSRYTYGQTRDRLEYAKRRVSALDTGDESRPRFDLSPPDAGAAEEPEGEVAPLSPERAPPPTVRVKVVPRPAVADPDAGPPAPEPPQPPAGCTADCRANWRTCMEPCRPTPGKAPEEASAKGAQCKRCDPDYKSCMQRCYR